LTKEESFMVAAYLEAIAPARPLADNETATHEGGIAFRADKWDRLRRFLILGTQGGTYYAGERELTVENVRVIQDCMAADWRRTVDEIVAVSEAGRAPKNEPAILALAYATCHTDVDARRYAYAAVTRVCRTGTHILHFAAYRKALTGKGMGKGMQRAVGRWFTEKNPKDLAYQAVKYPSRDGWALADLLRMARPKLDAQRSAVAKYIVDGEIPDGEVPSEGSVEDFLLSCIFVASEPTPDQKPETLRLVRELRLPRETLNTKWLNDPDVWDALLADMPATAMIRNLGKMSNVGLLTAGSDAERTVVAELGNAERLKRARVHPIAILAALKVYEQGHGERGKLAWTASKKVVTALDEAFYLAFGAVEPTGKRIRLALDVSSSMDGSKVNGMPFLSAREAAAAMALVTAAVEPKAHFVAYSHQLVPLEIRPSMRLDDVIRTMRAIPFGGTYCSLPIFDATDTGAKVDAFVSYTDSETRDGANFGYHGYGTAPRSTVGERLRDYRVRSGIDARHAVVAFTANDVSIADPNDPREMDFVGLDAAMPKLLSDFVAGVV
jgi:60 kDa SS-A/Ro ribonucleoprotein